MNPLLLYCIKAGASLTLLYGCYRLFLQRLTFYRANRYYLATAILLSVLVPLMDTSALWPQSVASYTVYVAQWADALPTQTPVVHAGNPAPQPTQISWIRAIFLAGVAVMAVRLLLQLLSLGRLRRRSTLRSREDGVRLYAVPEPVVPFSFGRSIYIHEPGYAPEEFRRIIEHETAHVRERHTVDIMLVQVLLLLQWWNPVAWLLNRSVRQNLEFLADRFVLVRGADRRQYQYLLLKVSGMQVPALVNAFNFSPLRNRIAMMNRNQSSKRQTARFLFALPLLLLLLAAFARKTTHPAVARRFIGIVVDAKTLQPLSNVVVGRDGIIATASDKRGFFTFTYPPPAVDTQKIRIGYYKDGYKPAEYGITYVHGSAEDAATLEFVGLSPKDSSYPTFSNGRSLSETEAAEYNAPDGAVVEKAYADFVHVIRTVARIRGLIKQSPDIYLEIDGDSYITNGHGFARLDGTDNIVIVDDTLKMTGAEVNKRYTRDQIDGTNGAYSRKIAQKKYGVDRDVFAIYLKKN